MIRLAVFGQPVKQSLSPRIHGLFAQQFGLDVDYRAIEASWETFSARVHELADAGGLGCNITMPFKTRAWKLATRSSERADRAEAANTLLFSSDGWFADNTDGGGLVADLQNCVGPQPNGARICLIGAGGAAAGVTAALLQEQPERLVIANRTPERAIALAARHADLGPVQHAGFEQLADLGPFDLLINATSLGHAGAAPALQAEWLAPGGLCYDMNYGRAARPLQSACAERGIACRDGLGMLVGQAALSFLLWTGHQPDTAAVLETLRRSTGE